MMINEIIEHLYNSVEVDDCIRRMVRPDHQQDFKQELFLKIYEIPEERLIGLYERKELKFYVVRSLINLVKNSSSVYNKNYVIPERAKVEPMKIDVSESNDEYKIGLANGESRMIDIDDPDDLIKRIEFEEKEIMLIDEINNKLDDEFGTHYYRNLVHLITEHGSMREVSRRTGIPIASISEAVKKVRNHLNRVYNGKPIKGIY